MKQGDILISGVLKPECMPSVFLPCGKKVEPGFASAAECDTDESGTVRMYIYAENATTEWTIEDPSNSGKLTFQVYDPIDVERTRAMFQTIEVDNLPDTNAGAKG